jgi:hypothetical protein
MSARRFTLADGRLWCNDIYVSISSYAGLSALKSTLSPPLANRRVLIDKTNRLESRIHREEA